MAALAPAAASTGRPIPAETGMGFFTSFGSAPAMIEQNYNAPATNVTFQLRR